MDGWYPVPHVHFDWEGDRDLCAAIAYRLPAHVRLPGHVDEQVIGSDPEGPGGITSRTDAPLVLGECVQDGSDAEGREDVRRYLEAELAPDCPGRLVVLRPKVGLAAHDHGDELVGRGEELVFDADSVLRILIPGNATCAFEVPERSAAPRIEQCLDGGVGVLRRVMDLRHVVHRGDAVIELGKPTEQLADVDVLRPVHGREPEKNVFEIGTASAR